MTGTIAYLSGAPRVSTRPEAELPGPRSHVLGVIGAFEALGWKVEPFIVGDQLPPRWSGRGSGKAVSRGHLVTLVADLLRLVMGAVNARRAWRRCGNHADWAYERLAVFQGLGRIFRRHQRPWIVETNGLLFAEAGGDRRSITLDSLARRLEIQTYRDCDVVVTVSESLKQLVVRESGIPKEKILVIPNAVDTSRFDPDKHVPRRLFDGFVVGFVGTLYGWQGLSPLLEAVRDLRQEGLGLSLVAVGDGPMRESWEDAARSLGIAPHVKFVGAVPWSEVPSYIAGFDLGFSGQTLLHVGSMYHSPLKIYEYMAMGRPVLASRFEDARRVLEAHDTGFLFDPDQPSTLKAALKSACEQQHRFPEMGRRARELVLSEHSWKQRAMAMVQGIQQILEQRP